MVLLNLSLSLENQSVSSASGGGVSGGEGAGSKTEASLFGQLLHVVHGAEGKNLPPAAVAERLGISLEQLQQLLAQLGQEVAQQTSAAPTAVAGATMAADSADALPPEDAEAFLLWLANQQQSLTPDRAGAGELAAAAASPLVNGQDSTPPAASPVPADSQTSVVDAASPSATVATAPTVDPLSAARMREAPWPGETLATAPPQVKRPEAGSGPTTAPQPPATAQPHPDQSAVDSALAPLVHGSTQRADDKHSPPPGASSSTAQQADTPSLASGGQGTIGAGQSAAGQNSAAAHRADLATAIRFAEASAAAPLPSAEMRSDLPSSLSAGAQPGSATPEPVTAGMRPHLPTAANNSAPQQPPSPLPLSESPVPEVAGGSDEVVLADSSRSSVPAKVQDERLLNVLGQQPEPQQEPSAEQQEADQRAAEQLLQLAAGRNGERSSADGQRGQQWPPLWQQFNVAPEAEAQAASATDSGGERLMAAAPSTPSAVDNRTLAGLQQRQSDSQPSPLLRHFAADPASALGNQLQLLVARNLDQITVRLDPQELGSMTIQLRLSEQQLNVQFQVANPHTRDMVEQALPRLREMLGEAGIQLGNAQVGQQQRDPQQLAGDGQPRQGGSTRGDSRMAGDEEQAADSQRQRLPRPVTVASGRLDFYV